MAKHPSVYQGNEPYIFVSYAHRDSDQVIPIIEQLQHWGFRVWYDAGIEAGTEWPEYIASHLRDSHAVIAFISEAAIQSPHCRQEITYAGAKHKKVLSIFMDDAELPAGLELQLGNNQSMFYNRAESFDAFIESLIIAELLRPCCTRPTALPTPSQPECASATRPKPTPRPTPTPAPAPVKKSKSALPKILIIGLLLVALIAGIALGFSKCDPVDPGESQDNSPAGKYQQAIELVANEQYYDAYVIFQELGDYEDSQVQSATIREKALIQKITLSKRGETVTWGSYEQNNDTSDGAEPIEWIVLHAEDGLTLLISKYGLDSRPFHDEQKDISWEKCDLRAWLNDEFYFDAFTSKEQAYLFESTIETEGSADTRDKVFLLSEEEAILYKSIIPTLEVTDYAIQHGVRTHEPYWWLRSPWNESTMDYADAGYFDMKNTTMHYVDTNGVAIRPCIWVDTRTETQLQDSYNTALALFDTQQYKKALEAFQKLGDYEDSAEYCSRLPKLILMKPYMEAEIGDVVTLGSYEFIVLEKQVDRILIVSKYGIESKDFHNYSLSTVTWEECSLREWLNDSFLKNGLGANNEEISLIISANVTTDDNPEFNTTGGQDTIDRVFILSYEEIMKYFPDAKDRIVYAQNNTSFPVAWWTRTKGETESKAVYVDQSGNIILAGNHIFQLSPEEYVRPAMWIKISE